jgi:signal-transduction protein with cAMP-binding, CBS, and nucleotidyltransferase domain
MNQTKVRDIMTHSPVIMSPEKTVQDAARLMKEHNSGALLIGSSEHAQGIITDRDIAVHIVAEGKDPARTHLKAFLNKPLHSCDVHATLEEAAEQMRLHEVRRLVVLNDGRTNGVITLATLLQHAGTQKLSDQVLHTLLGSSRKCHATKKEASLETSGSECENYDNFEGVF